MPLYLATHTQEVVTAKVPLTMIMLLDFLKRKSLPADLKCRVVLPTCGAVSVSVWDAPSEEALLEWLHTNLQHDATHAVHEAQEEFSWGLSFELSRARAAEKMVAGSRGALDRLSATAAKAGDGITKQLEALDQRSGILTAAEAALTRVRTAASSTFQPAPGAAAGAGAGVGAAAREGGPEAAEELGGAGSRSTASAYTANVTANVKEGLTKAGATFSWLGSTLREQLRTATMTAQQQQQQAAGSPYKSAGSDAGGMQPGGGLAADTAAVGGGLRGDRHMHEEEDAPLVSLPQVSLSPPPQHDVPAGAAAAAAAAGGGAPPLPVSLAGPGLTTPAAPPAPQFTLDDDEASPAKP